MRDEQATSTAVVGGAAYSDRGHFASSQCRLLTVDGGLFLAHGLSVDDLV